MTRLRLIVRPGSQCLSWGIVWIPVSTIDRKQRWLSSKPAQQHALCVSYPPADETDSVVASDPGAANRTAPCPPLTGQRDVSVHRAQHPAG